MPTPYPDPDPNPNPNPNQARLEGDAVADARDAARPIAAEHGDHGVEREVAEDGAAEHGHLVRVRVGLRARVRVRARARVRLRLRVRLRRRVRVRLRLRVRVRPRVRVRVRVRDGAHLPVGHHVLAAEEAQQRGLARAVGACSG